MYFLFLKNLPSIIRKTGAYLEKQLNDDQVKSLEEHLSFNSMKKNPIIFSTTNLAASINESKIFGKNFKAEGEFFRKGESEQWKNSMPEEVIKQFDEWTETKLKDHRDLNNEFMY